MRILVIGPPGAGKGTQAKCLCNEYDLPHLSAGQLLREAIENETDAGMRAKPYIDKGQLVPVEVVVEIMSREMFDVPGRQGFVADGFPRNVEQYEHLNDELVQRNEEIDLAIQLDLDEEDVKKRLTGRKTCSECGRNYHVEFYPPEKNDVCNRCGADLYERTDDNIDTIKHRLKVYKNESVPVLDRLEDDGLLRRVDASGDIDIVFRRICNIIEEEIACVADDQA
jgi:adenylate kinase